jgi:hypothetical protein
MLALKHFRTQLRRGHVAEWTGGLFAVISMLMHAMIMVILVSS